jgi:ABC-type uncharacterized transport system permease subunit
MAGAFLLYFWGLDGAEFPSYPSAVNWLSDRQWFSVAVVIYGASMFYSVFLWRRGFRQDNRVNYFVLLAALIPHTLSLVSRGFSLNQCPVTNLYEATAFVLWTISAAYIGIGLWPKLRFIGAFASPLLFAAGVFALMPGLDQQSEKPEFINGAVSLHATLILLSYGTFGLSAIAGAMFLSQEHDLKFNKLRAILSRLPPIQRLDRITAGLLIAGIALLTAGLAMAPLIYPETNTSFQLDAKIIWSGIVWIMYAGLVVARLKLGLQGRRFALGSVLVFTFVILTFWGTNLMSSMHQ